ncbi:hypothetical protein WMY93_033827, partial [Mugilogobius chulae]
SQPNINHLQGPLPPHLSQCPSLTSPSTGTFTSHSQCPSLTSPSTGTFTSSLSQPVSQPNITIYRDLYLLTLSVPA